MRYDIGRRIVAGAMAACLALLVLMCADGRTIIRWTAEISNPRQNESLYIELRGDGVIFVGGEGKLYGTDMRAMVEGESLFISDVRHVVVGNGITEIGYDAFSRYESLETLWLGRDVVVAGNGSVRECDSLEFIFIPEGMERAGKDFLYDCNKCRVVTDGSAESLPKMKNVGDSRVVAEIDSYDALVNACGPEEELPDALRQWYL